VNSRHLVTEASASQANAVSVGPDAKARVQPSDLAVPDELSRRRLRSRLLIGASVLLVVVALIVLLPGLGELRSLLARAKPGWLALGAGLKVLSGLGYVAVFRMVFCRRMSWRVSYQVGMSELGANALFPTGGAGGLVLGAWALRRGGMTPREIARRTVAFFLLTSVPNVVSLILVGLALATGIFPGTTNLALTLIPAAVALLAIFAALLAGRVAAHLRGRLERRKGDHPSRKLRATLDSLTALSDGVDEAVALLRERNPILIAGMIAYLGFDVLILWTSFRAFGAEPALAIVVIAYLIGELGGLIPIPGGFGGVEAGLVGALVLYGVSLTPATAAVLAYRATALWVPALLGAAAFVALRRTLRHEADQIAVCAPQAEMDVIGRGRVVIGSPTPT
jgi:uncharacterized protein (TIRG00374 family)